MVNRHPCRRFFTALALTTALAGASFSALAQKVELLNVSYDPTRELYVEFNAAFAKHWKAKTGQDVTVKQSHGGSGKQARGIIDGAWTPMWPRWRWRVIPMLCMLSAA